LSKKHQPILNLFDHVKYTGEKFPQLRSQNAIGVIDGRTSDGLMSVSFSEGAYLLHPSNLAKVNFSEDANEKAAQKWARKVKEDASSEKAK